MAERLAAPGIALSSGAGVVYAEADGRDAFGSRVLAYLVDTAVLFGFATLFTVLAGLVILVGTGSGRNTISDTQEWAFSAILLATWPAWLLFNLALCARRGQTVGQYVIGLRIVDEAGDAPGYRRVLGYLLSLHPLIFHPMLSGPWLLVGFLGVALAENEVILVLALAVALLCLVGPLANFVFALFDPQRRALHDRLAGLRVVRL
jgi:uncharacterized RDD family membrane protein YckC